MPAKRIEFTVSEEQWERVERARGLVPRAAFVKAALESALRGLEFDRVSDREGAAHDPERAAAMFVQARTEIEAAKATRDRHAALTPEEQLAEGERVLRAGIARASSQAKRDVRPIPKGDK